MLAAYKKTYKVSVVDPYGVYGYETMALALDALKRAGAKANDRNEVIKLLFQTKNRASVLGPAPIRSRRAATRASPTTAA